MSGNNLESDPVAKGYVKNMSCRAKQYTGIFLDIPELSGKQVGLLREVVPRLSRIAIFAVPGLNAPQFKAMKTAARTFNVEAESMSMVLDRYGIAGHIPRWRAASRFDLES